MLLNHLKYNRESNISFIKPIYLIATCMLQVPPYDFERKSLKESKLQKFACLALICFLIVASIATMFGKIIYFYFTLMLSIIIVDFGLSVSQILVHIYITTLPLLKTEEMKDFFEIFEAADRKLKIAKINQGKWCYKFYGEIIFGHVCFMVIFFYEIIVWLLNYPPHIFPTLLLKSVLYYPTLIYMLLLRNLLVALQARFECLNNTLSKSFMLRQQQKLNTLVLVDNPLDVKCLTKVYIHLCDLIRHFNNLFGKHIVLLIIYAILSILMPLCLAIIDATHDEPVVMGDVNLKKYLIILCVCWFLVITVRHLFIIQ